MKRSLVVLSLVSLVFAGVAGAEVRKGDVQLDFLAGWAQQSFSDNIGGGNVNVYFGALRPGYAVTDNIRVGAVGAVLHTTFSSGHATAWALGASGEYVFMPASTLNPYIGAQVAYASVQGGGLGLGTGTEYGWMWGPRVGALYTLNRTNNLFGEFQYQMWEGKVRNVLDKGYMVVFGIEHKFKTGQ
jgi:hypothetical protein